MKNRERRSLRSRAREYPFPSHTFVRSFTACNAVQSSFSGANNIWRANARWQRVQLISPGLNWLPARRVIKSHAPLAHALPIQSAVVAPIARFLSGRLAHMGRTCHARPSDTVASLIYRSTCEPSACSIDASRFNRRKHVTQQVYLVK